VHGRGTFPTHRCSSSFGRQFCGLSDVGVVRLLEARTSNEFVFDLSVLRLYVDAKVEGDREKDEKGGECKSGELVRLPLHFAFEDATPLVSASVYLLLHVQAAQEEFLFIDRRVVEADEVQIFRAAVPADVSSIVRNPMSLDALLVKFDESLVARKIRVQLFLLRRLIEMITMIARAVRPG